MSGLGVGEEKLPDALFFVGLTICCVHQPNERQSCNGRSYPFQRTGSRG
jgi:hypothetical protein